MLPDGSLPVQKRPWFKRLDENRLIIPVECVPKWAKGQHAEALHMVPLAWKRALPALPAANRLDCWYLWNSAIVDAEWELDPRESARFQMTNYAGDWNF
jgi:hypothetical protein